MSCVERVISWGSRPTAAFFHALGHPDRGRTADAQPGGEFSGSQAILAPECVQQQVLPEDDAVRFEQNGADLAHPLRRLGEQPNQGHVIHAYLHG
jgi:hypothetical protein